MQPKDPGRLTESLRLLPQQVAAGWDAAAKVALPSRLRSTDSILVAGMGGSHLGPHIAASGFASQLSKPITIHPDYGLPGWVSKRTLVIASSYSGSTEEVLDAFREAGRRGLPRLALCGGGKLAAEAKRAKVPAIIFPTETNPSGQPRFGVGINLGAFLNLLTRIGALPAKAVSRPELVSAGTIAGRASHGRGNPTTKMLTGRTPLLLAAEHLVGAAHAATNMLNENAKTPAVWFALPDANHHLLEGLAQPKSTVRNLTVVAFDSKLYRPENRKRLALTLSVFKKRGAKTLTVHPTGASPLAEALFILAWGGRVSVALARRTKQAADKIPTVEYFKRRLAK